MNRNVPAVDYRKFRLSKLNTDEFRHLTLLIFWPIFGLLFQLTERVFIADEYHPVYIPLDDLIPFEEIFVIPYMFWFVYLVGIQIYTLLYDPEAFRKLMKFIIITYSAALIFYWIYPTCQNLRPVFFERDNVLVRFMRAFYRFDTHTNVCPSIHVIGSVAVWAAGWNEKRLKSVWWKVGFTVTTILICLSTVFLKQHSALDVFAALPLCALAYRFCYKSGAPVRGFCRKTEEANL